MNPLDSVGNVLNEKDLVAVHIGDKTLVGTVIKIKESSMLMAEGNQVVPGMLTIGLQINSIFDHANKRLADVYKLVKPPTIETKLTQA